MENIIIRVIEKLFILYFLGYFLIDIALFIIFLVTFHSDKKKYDVSFKEIDPLHRVTVIVPAYNEEVSILHCIHMLKKLDYPDFEIIIINDGSTDKTKETLLNSISFKPVEINITDTINTADVKDVYSTEDEKILFINKVNGGKADSINAGINYSSGEFICTIDADSILDRNSLKAVVTPMIMDSSVIVTGGQLAVSNDTVIENNKIVNFRMPHNIWVLWQITEYIKSFLVSRIGLSKINSLLIMSGAFSLYRRNDLLNTGGFLTSVNNHSYIRNIFKEEKSTVCEDMEIVVRLSRYYLENNKKGRVVFLPKPLCWTEVPDNYANLYKQRSRWQLGLAECLFMHSRMFFDPRYKATGMLAFPYYFFLEFLSPIIKIFAFAFIAFVGIQGLINLKWVMFMLLFITVTTALITSIITVFIERWSEKQATGNRDALRYKSAGDWIKLIISSIIGDFSYSFFKIFAQLKGTLDFIRKKSDWNKFERRGIKKVDVPGTSEIKLKSVN